MERTELVLSLKHAKRRRLVFLINRLKWYTRQVFSISKSTARYTVNFLSMRSSQIRIVHRLLSKITLFSDRFKCIAIWHLWRPPPQPPTPTPESNGTFRSAATFSTKVHRFPQARHQVWRTLCPSTHASHHQANKANSCTY